MTDDFKRLCEAAESAYDEFKKGGYTCGPDEYTIEATPQAIVRAVLLALREPSEETKEAGGSQGMGFYLECPDCVGDETATQVFTTMIDHILADPVKA